MEKVRIELDKEAFNIMLIHGRFNKIPIIEDNKTKYIDTKYEIKEVVIEDDLFKDDEIYNDLKRKSIKAYKELMEYQYRKRFNVKK